MQFYWLQRVIIHFCKLQKNYSNLKWNQVRKIKIQYSKSATIEISCYFYRIFEFEILNILSFCQSTNSHLTDLSLKQYVFLTDFALPRSFNQDRTDGRERGRANIVQTWCKIDPQRTKLSSTLAKFQKRWLIFACWLTSFLRKIQFFVSVLWTENDVFIALIKENGSRIILLKCGKIKFPNCTVSCYSMQKLIKIALFREFVRKNIVCHMCGTGFLV